MTRPRSGSAVQKAIRQKAPFRSLEQETTIALLRTASVVGRALERVILPSGVSLAQYNALRIVRGAGRDGIASLEVRDRMIEEGTTITRILDSLEKAHLIRRERGTEDRRLLLCRVTEKGAALLDRLRATVDRADEEAMAALRPGEMRELLRLLDALRDGNAERGAPRHRVRRAVSA